MDTSIDVQQLYAVAALPHRARQRRHVVLVGTIVAAAPVPSATFWWSAVRVLTRRRPRASVSSRLSSAARHHVMGVFVVKASSL